MNEPDLYLEVVLTSLSTIGVTLTFAIESRKPLDIEAWFQRTTNRK